MGDLLEVLRCTIRFIDLLEVLPLSGVPVMLLTATATAEARAQLVDRFCPPGLPLLQLVGSIDRPPVSISVRPMPRCFSSGGMTSMREH